MATDDYFVVMYRILAYLYACLKEGSKPDLNQISYEKLKITEAYWMSIVDNMIDKGYIKGAVVGSVVGGGKQISLKNAEITQEGVVFLDENSRMAKAKEFLKTLKETIPGL